MKSPILIITLALAVCCFTALGKAKHKPKPKAKAKHKVAAAAPIPADKSFTTFNLEFAGGKKSQNFTSTDVHTTYGLSGYFSMSAGFKSGEKFEISYYATDKAPTPRHQLMRSPETKSRYYIRFIQRDRSELYFSGYDLNFINTKDGITADIKLLTAGQNTMQSLHVRLLKVK